MSDKANSSLYGYRTLSEESFDTDFSSLCLSVTIILAFFYVYTTLCFQQFTPIPKNVINIHENKNQMTYKLLLLRARRN